MADGLVMLATGTVRWPLKSEDAAAQGTVSWDSLPS